MILELAIGDAYGAGFEYVRDRRFIKNNNDLSSYIKHPRHNRKKGVYTDDAQMSIAIAELILEEDKWTPELIASKFLEVFHRDKRGGYAGGFQAFLKKTKSGKEFIENIRPTSDKSGAAMRSGPIGVYATIEEVISRSNQQASITHNTRDGKNAAIVASLMTHYFLYDLGPKSDLPGFLCKNVEGKWDEPWRGEVGSRGWMSVRAAITSITKNNSLSSILKSSVAWTGDTDTVATIALAAASCSDEIVKDIPEVLIKNLENRKYGRDYLISLDKKLMKCKRKSEFRR